MSRLFFLSIDHLIGSSPLPFFVVPCLHPDALQIMPICWKFETVTYQYFPLVNLPVLEH